MENPFAQEPRATSAWLWQVFTGVGLVILLGLHLIANHFIAMATQGEVGCSIGHWAVSLNEYSMLPR